jgi:gamma-glutamylcyclotransferase
MPPPPEASVEEGVFVFAYGSNLDSERMRRRVPSAELVGVTELPLHTLQFNKRSSKDGTAKANAFLTESASDTVEGVLYRTDAAGLAALDRIEGRGYGYERHAMPFSVVEGGQIRMYQASIYIAEESHVDHALLPAEWYLAHVIRGAKEHGLSDGLLAWLEEHPFRDGQGTEVE